MADSGVFHFDEDFIGADFIVYYFREDEWIIGFVDDVGF